MHTQPSPGADPPEETRHTRSTARFDYTMFALAGVLFLTITAAASILLTLPEALETVAAPAFGAPWITAPAASIAKSDAAPAPVPCIP